MYRYYCRICYHRQHCIFSFILQMLYTWRHQYSETNVMHFLFNLLRIKGFYMFRALLVHPQAVLHNRHLVYCVRVMSIGCTRVGVEHNTHAIYQMAFV
jgi:hypothetical protein